MNIRAVILTCASLAALGCDSEEREVALPNGYQLVTISGPTTYILDAEHSIAIPTRDSFTIVTYGVAGNFLAGECMGKWNGGSVFYFLDTTTGSIHEYESSDALREAWSQKTTNSFPTLKSWDR